MIKQILSFLFVLCFCLNSYSQIDGVRVTYIRNPDNSCDFYYEKNDYATYHLIIKFEAIKNTKPFFYEGNIKENSGFLFQLKPIKAEKKIKFICEPFFLKGNPNPKIDRNFKYLLPFKNDQKVEISTIMMMLDGLDEGNNYYASFINYSSSLQTETIHAMRKGIVINVINEYDFDPKSFDIFYEKRNSITIEHEDGTLATYSGFNKNSIRVKIGQTVLPTDYLGVLEKSVDNWYHLFFQIYYRAYVKDVFPDKKEDLNSRIAKKIDPFFHTKNGIITLDGALYDTKNYIVETPDEIITQEFTKEDFQKRTESLSKIKLKTNTATSY
ncbi:hypothetical protein [Flavobacterium flavipallidum]|jgi:flagellar assembly factor FliW|uniref:Uncharacterized protein n=1 Tax=Flavobacterium flavipallidum TaxID=3139140 RepID=A0ABU9HN99_9FLAO